MPSKFLIIIPRGFDILNYPGKFWNRVIFNKNTISGATWDLDATYPAIVYKQDRGLSRLLKFKENVSALPDEQPGPKQSKPKAIREEDFYEPFAKWLVNELEECTSAIGLGGNIFRDKWGPPM